MDINSLIGKTSKYYFPKSWLFLVWQLSMFMLLLTQFARIVGFSEYMLSKYVFLFAVSGAIGFVMWIVSVFVRLSIKERKKIAIKDLKVSLISATIFFVSLFVVIVYFPAGQKQVIAPIVQISKNEEDAREYYFHEVYPENSYRMYDLTQAGDPRRFLLYLFDDKLKTVSFDNRTELRIETNDVVVFKMYGNNIYRSELLKVATSSSEYTQREVFYKGSNFEKEAKVFHKQSGDKYIYHYQFKYGDLDYLITAEWKTEKDYSDLANKLIATLAPTTISVDSANKAIQNIACNDGLCDKIVKTLSPTPTEKPLHIVYCYVDREGKFDIFYTECQSMANKDKEGFRRRAIDICVEGRSPALKDQGTKEQRQKLCPSIFSGESFPIANVPK